MAVLLIASLSRNVFFSLSYAQTPPVHFNLHEKTAGSHSLSQLVVTRWQLCC